MSDGAERQTAMTMRTAFRPLGFGIATFAWSCASAAPAPAAPAPLATPQGGAAPGGPAPSLPAAPAPVLAARTLRCEAPLENVGATLQLDEQGRLYSGTAQDNYGQARYAACPAGGARVACRGTWSYKDLPAELEIEARADGAILGRITRLSGERLTMSCVASSNAAW